MKLELTLSQPVLPCAAEAEVVFLARLTPGVAAPGVRPVDVRFVLDRSYSMGEPSGLGGLTKLEALKQACSAAIDQLVAGRDRAGVWAFAAQAAVPLVWQALARRADLAALKKAIDKLSLQGGTAFADALGGAVAAPRDGAATTLVVFLTDGVPYCPDVDAERARTLALAERAGELGLTLLVYGTGVSYDEAFLRQVAEHAGGGSRFAHLSDVSALGAELAREIQLGAAAQASEVEFVVVAAPGASLSEVTAMLPAQHEVVIHGAGGAGGAGQARERAGVVDARGRAYVVRARLADASVAATRDVARVEVSWRDAGGAQREVREVLVELSGDAARVSAPDAVVRATVLTAAGARATMRGDLGLARTLFGSAGNATMLGALATLGTAAAGGDEDAARSLRTRVMTPGLAMGTAKGDE